MTQRKKQATLNQQQKAAKAQQRNDFFCKLKYVCGICCSEENIYSLIPSRILDITYEYSARAMRIVPMEGTIIPDGILDDLRKNFARMLKAYYLPITPGKPELSIAEFYTFAHTIRGLYECLNDEVFPNAPKVKAALANFATNNELETKALEKLYDILFTLGSAYSEIGNRLYWLKYNLSTDKSSTALLNIIELYSYISESIPVEFKGHIRPAHPVCWTYCHNGVVKAFFEPPKFNIIHKVKKMNIYIQSHALERISERIDCIYSGVIHYNIFLSLAEPKVFFVNQRMLIEYRIWETKAGYFVTDMVNDNLILRTFLFVTNNGTPEGQLLEKNTGLQKLDKKYLAIDKLSTFMSSDIGENAEVQKIFQDAGCQCVMDLCETTKGFRVQLPNHPIAAQMLHYLEYRKTLIPELEETP